jgi:hypothetical protein
MKKNQNSGYEDELEIDEMLNELENQTDDSPEFIFHSYNYEYCVDLEYSWQHIHDYEDEFRHLTYEYEEMIKNGYIDSEELAADKQLNDLENSLRESPDFLEWDKNCESFLEWFCWRLDNCEIGGDRFSEELTVRNR